jgi:hypothetical protein
MTSVNQRECRAFKPSTPLRSACALAAVLVCAAQLLFAQDDDDAPPQSAPDAAAQWQSGHVIVNAAVHFDRSAPLPALFAAYKLPPPPPRRHPPAATSPEEEKPLPPVTLSPAGAAVEQTTQGTRPAAAIVSSFDGLGTGFTGPQGTAEYRNPTDDSLAAGLNEIVQIVNSRMAIYTKQGAHYPTTGKVLFGPVITNTLFAGFGGPCEKLVSGDAVVRYDQLANRWLFVLPIFRRAPDQPDAPYAMCYALSTGPDPLGSYFRYQFDRPLFPDYPRPAIWTDGYYLPTSTGDTVIQKHVCAADRSKMLAGQNATEQCFVIDGVNFLNSSDIDGRRLPPAGMPNIVMAAGGTQLHGIFEDDGIYAWKFWVNWDDPSQSRLAGPDKIAVAPYHYLCNGQLSKCVPQPGTDVRLDAQGDKIMQRLVYRNFGRTQSIVAAHSIDTRAGGGVRWYEFRLDKSIGKSGALSLVQQGTYAPGGGFRWMPSIAMDAKGNIAIGYSFGGQSIFPGQRFTARLAADPKGEMTFAESVVAEGQAAQTNTLRWEDFTTLAIDPTDDCTFWYVGDYLKTGAENYSTRIAALRLPGCSGRRKRFGLF